MEIMASVELINEYGAGMNEPDRGMNELREVD
jgi:hypothetical protein